VSPRAARAATAPPALTAARLRTELRRRLGEGERTVLWEEHGDRVLVHASKAETRIHDEGVVVAVPLETDETGVATLEVALALAHGDEEPSLLAVTDDQPSGERALAGRWGHALQEAVFEALLDLLDEACAGNGAKPAGLRVGGGKLELAVRGARR
jgi:hypothetical protein